MLYNILVYLITINRLNMLHNTECDYYFLKYSEKNSFKAKNLVAN